MGRKVSSAEAKAKLSELVSEVAFGGQHIIIERRGKALAAIVSISDLELLVQGRAMSSHPKGALALVGAWKEIPEEELDKLIEDIYEDREKDTGRTVHLRV